MIERRVWIAQCMCPKRHAILACAGEADDAKEAREAIAKPLATALAAKIATREIDPWCGLCRARVEDWNVEVGRTAFRTMAEAEPALRRSERDQAATRAMWWGLSGKD